MNLKVTRQPDGWFVAIDEDNYEAENDGVVWWSSSPQGVSKTEIGAIRALLDNIEERQKP